MIVVRVELHSAVTHLVTEIARFDIWNDTTGTHTHGNYECASFRGRDKASLAHRTVQRKGVVKNYPRLNQHVLNLVAKALEAMKYGK